MQELISNSRVQTLFGFCHSFISGTIIFPQSFLLFTAERHTLSNKHTILLTKPSLSIIQILKYLFIMVKHQWITKSAQRIKKQKKNMLPWGKKKKKKVYWTYPVIIHLSAPFSWRFWMGRRDRGRAVGMNSLVQVIYHSEYSKTTTLRNSLLFDRNQVTD